MDGTTNKEERRELVQKFQDKERKVFLISLKAGGTGINLTAAEAVIHFDPSGGMFQQKIRQVIVLIV